MARACDRYGEIPFIDVRQCGPIVDQTLREFTDNDISRVADTNQGWRTEEQAVDFAKDLGFFNSVTSDDVRDYGHMLRPGRHDGAVEPQRGDGEPIGAKLKRPVAELREQRAKGGWLDAAITAT